MSQGPGTVMWMSLSIVLPAAQKMLFENPLKQQLCDLNAPAAKMRIVDLPVRAQIPTCVWEA